MYTRAQAADSFTPRSNSSSPQSQYRCHLHKIAISFTQDCNIIYTRYQFHLHKISTSSTQNINVINIHPSYQYQPYMTSMSSTQSINVIHTKYKCHPHMISMSFTQDLNLSAQDVNYKHKISMSSAQDKKCQPHKLSMWSTQDINVIQTKYQHYSYILSMSSTLDMNFIHARYLQTVCHLHHNISCIHTTYQSHVHKIPRLAPPSPYNPTTDTRHSGNKSITQAGLIYLYM